jgi:hypothetical protein
LVDGGSLNDGSDSGEGFAFQIDSDRLVADAERLALQADQAMAEAKRQLGRLVRASSRTSLAGGAAEAVRIAEALQRLSTTADATTTEETTADATAAAAPSGPVLQRKLELTTSSGALDLLRARREARRCKAHGTKPKNGPDDLLAHSGCPPGEAAEDADPSPAAVPLRRTMSSRRPSAPRRVEIERTVSSDLEDLLRERRRARGVPDPASEDPAPEESTPRRQTLFARAATPPNEAVGPAPPSTDRAEELSRAAAAHLAAMRRHPRRRSDGAAPGIPSTPPLQPPATPLGSEARGQEGEPETVHRTLSLTLTAAKRHIETTYGSCSEETLHAALKAGVEQGKLKINADGAFEVKSPRRADVE